MFRYGLVLKDKAFIRKVMIVALPMIFQQLLTGSVNLLDNLMVGQLGDFAIAGVATSNRYFMISFFSMMAIGSASMIFLSQAYGAKKPEMMKQSFRYGIIYSLLITLIFSTLALLFPLQILRFFSDNEGMIESALRYMPIAALTFFPQSVSFVIQSAMRSMGKTRPPLISSILSLVINAVFNYFLIFGKFGFPQLGILGAALGTLIARFVELGYLLFVLKYNEFPFETKVTDLFKVDKELQKSITLKALPLLLNELGWSGGMAMLFKFYATRGPVTLAALPIASTTGDLFFVLMSGMAVATMVMVSHPLGANNLEEARHNGYQMVQLATFLAVLFGLGLFSASFVTPYLYNVSEEVRSLAQNIIRIQGLLFFIYMYNAQNFFVIRAGGDTRSTLIMDAGFMWGVNLVIVGFIAYFTNYNIYVLYIAGQMTDVIKMIVTTFYFRKEKWVKNLTESSHELDFVNGA